MPRHCANDPIDNPSHDPMNGAPHNPPGPRRTMKSRRAVYAAGACAVALVIPLAAYAAAGPADAAAANLLADPGFETGSLSGWSCDAGPAAVVPSPVRTASPTSSPTAKPSATATITATATPTASATPTGAPTGTGPGGSVGKVAPYVDMTNDEEGMLLNAAKAGLKTYTTAFVVAGGCSPIWGDTLPVNNDPTISGDIAAAKADGATPIVSFGGSGGTELAQACTTEASLQAAYQEVITSLGVTHLDFDIEGPTLDYTGANNLRFEAINGLEAANPGLVVSVTLPTFPTGLAADGVAFLGLAKLDNTRIDLVNVMAMDYGSSFTGDMGQEAIGAAEGTLAQVKAVWPADTYANVGVTPMIGINDQSSEDFTEADAQALVAWADAAHPGRLSFWSVDRDQPCSGSVAGLPECSEISRQPLDFTKIFDGYTG